MSSILRALKKLENKPLENKTALSLVLESSAQRATGRDRIRRYRIFCILLAASFLLFGGWQMFKYGPAVMGRHFPEKPHPKPLETGGKNVLARGGKQPDTTQLKPPAKKTLAVATDGRRPRVMTPKNIIAPRGGIAVLEKRQNHVTAEDKNIIRGLQAELMEKRSQTAPAATLKTRAAPVKPAISSRRGVPFSRKTQPPDSRPTKNESKIRIGKPVIGENQGGIGFEVQAIAWSSIPENRIAVINGGVVREGEYVDGAYVVQIGKDDVSLKKGDQTWQLRCGR